MVIRANFSAKFYLLIFIILVLAIACILILHSILRDVSLSVIPPAILLVFGIVVLLTLLSWPDKIVIRDNLLVYRNQSITLNQVTKVEAILDSRKSIFLCLYTKNQFQNRPFKIELIAFSNQQIQRLFTFIKKNIALANFNEAFIKIASGDFSDLNRVKKLLLYRIVAGAYLRRM